MKIQRERFHSFFHISTTVAGVWLFWINPEIRLFRPENEALINHANHFFVVGFFLAWGQVVQGTGHNYRSLMPTCPDSCLHVTPQVVHSYVTTELHSKQSSTKEPAIEGYDVSVFSPYAFCCWIFSAIHPSIHPSIHFLPLIWDRVMGAAVWAGTPRLPSPWTLPIAPLGGSQGVARPAEWHRHSSMSWRGFSAPPLQKKKKGRLIEKSIWFLSV